MFSQSVQLLIPSFSALMPVFAVKVFHTGPEGLGLLLSSVGIGGVLGGLASVWTTRLEKVGLTLVIAVLVFAMALIGFALSSNIYMATFFLVIAGAAEMINMSSSHTAIQMSAPIELRGRVAGLLPIFPALMALGALSTGACADWLGPASAVIGLSVSAALIVILAWLRSPQLRALSLSQMTQTLK